MPTNISQNSCNYCFCNYCRSSYNINPVKNNIKTLTWKPYHTFGCIVHCLWSLVNTRIGWIYATFTPCPAISVIAYDLAIMEAIHSAL